MNSGAVDATARNNDLDGEGGSSNMMSFIRKRLTLANGAAVLALVFAMSGGAFAASHATSAKHHKKHKSSVVITSVHQISKSVLAALKGPIGPVGPEGKPGAAGKDGSPGAPGEKGAAGVSAKAVAFAGEQHGCKEGGIEVTSGSPAVFVCNGEKGSEGKSVTSKSFEGTSEPAGEPCKEAGGDEFEVQGSGVKSYVCNGGGASGGESCFPQTSGTLASGCTERGQFAIQYKVLTGASRSFAAISFPTPLAVALGEEGAAGTEVHFLKPGETAAGCTGSASSPTAAKGVLCIYTTVEENIEAGSQEVFNGETAGVNPSAGKSGAVIEVKGEAEGRAFIYGTFAVTAP
jgi:hypothetical protein